MLEALKKEVIEISLKAQREGLCRHKSGNMSAIDPETGLVVITPTGIDRELLKVDDMIVMDLTGLVVENKTGLKPTSEAMMHIAVYKERPEVKGIVHTHSMYASVFACLNEPILPVSFEMVFMNAKEGRVPVAPYGHAGTKDLAESVRITCREADGFLLQSHGVVAVDTTSLEGAYLRACYVEELAQQYYLIYSVTGKEKLPLFPVSELYCTYPEEIRFQNQEIK